MKTVDARGQPCPQPVIMTRQAISELAQGEQARILLDSQTSCRNVESFLKDRGMAPQTAVEDGVFTVTVVASAAVQSPSKALSDGVPALRPHVIVFCRNRMGQGPDELGEVLIKSFVNVIKTAAPLPSHLIFYNTGVLLVVEGSALIESLRELEDMGVKLLVCGTCLDYFGKKESVRAGTVSNMYTILETMTAAGHIIQP